MDGGGNSSSLGGRHGPVVGAVEDRRGSDHLRGVGRDVEVVAESEQPARRCGVAGSALIQGERGPEPRVGIGSEDVGEHVGPQAPVLLHEAENVLAHAARAEVVAAEPASVQDQTTNRLWPSTGPDQGERHGQRSGDEVE